MKRSIIAIVCMVIMLAVMGIACVGCTDSEIVNYNISQDAQYFKCERRVVVYNARTDAVIFEAEGFLNIETNDYNELVLTFKVGDDKYKKNYIYLNEYTIYVVEDITGTDSDPNHYKWYIHDNFIDIEMEPEN